MILGTSEACAQAARGRAGGGARRGASRRAVAARIASEVRRSGGKLPGFGHPVHRPLDPRAERILELADERGVSGPHVLLARCLRDGAAEAWGRPLTMNVSMPIAAVMLDLGFPRRRRQGGADPRAHRRSARAPGRGARAADRVPDGRAAPRRRSGTSAGSSTDARPGDRGAPMGASSSRSTTRATGRSSRTCSSVRAFYREKLAPPGSRSAREAGGLDRDRAAAADREAGAEGDLRRPRTRSARTCAPRARRSSGSTRRAARPARRATSR